MAYNAIDIAKKIVCRTDEEHGDTISNLKLQKLLYFAQGFHLAAFGEALFCQDMVAWTYGPVVPEVYDVSSKGTVTVLSTLTSGTLRFQPVLE